MVWGTVHARARARRRLSLRYSKGKARMPIAGVPDACLLGKLSPCSACGQPGPRHHVSHCMHPSIRAEMSGPRSNKLVWDNALRLRLGHNRQHDGSNNTKCTLHWGGGRLLLGQRCMQDAWRCRGAPPARAHGRGMHVHACSRMPACSSYRRKRKSVSLRTDPCGLPKLSYVWAGGKPLMRPPCPQPCAAHPASPPLLRAPLQSCRSSPWH